MTAALAVHGQSNSVLLFYFLKASPME